MKTLFSTIGLLFFCITLAVLGCNDASSSIAKGSVISSIPIERKRVFSNAAALAMSKYGGSGTVLPHLDATLRENVERSGIDSQRAWIVLFDWIEDRSVFRIVVLPFPTETPVPDGGAPLLDIYVAPAEIENPREEVGSRHH